jgi:two-component system chemotaxis sensor kinase CheA
MLLSEMQDAAVDLRLVQVGDVFRRMRRMVRELERQTAKKISLVLAGEGTEIDKMVADSLYEPLVHVLRNAIDHGLETPAERLAAGKPETGIIALSAMQSGGEIQITVRDDGRGLSRDKILARARAQGLIGENEQPEDQQLWKVIFQPGFSTAETVTSLSGRGVGMDVLNTAMKALRGRISIDSQLGKGTSVALVIPLSLAFLESLVMRIDQRLYATPIDVVNEVFRPEQQQINAVSAGNGTEMLLIRDELVPVCRLQRFYGEDCRQVKSLVEMIIVIFRTTSGLIGLPVDEIYDQQQVVMKPLQGYLEQIRASVGCALLSNGDVAVVLDCEQLAEIKSL